MAAALCVLGLTATAAVAGSDSGQRADHDLEALHEDGEMLTGHNDLWSCLDDGNAEWTGGLFNADGSRFFVSIQHNITGHGVVLEITGWK